MKKATKATMLFLCLGLAVLTSCKKDKWLDPPHQHENTTGTHTGVNVPVDSTTLNQDNVCPICSLEVCICTTGNGDGENLLNLEYGATYDIKEATLYQYDENGTYTFGVTLITHQRVDVGQIHLSNSGGGYFHSNIFPEGGFNDGNPLHPSDVYPPTRPWGSSENYDFVFPFGMIGYIINEEKTHAHFSLYNINCDGDTMYFNSSLEIVPTMESDNTIRLEQFRQGSPVYGQNERRIVYLLEKI